MIDKHNSIRLDYFLRRQFSKIDEACLIVTLLKISVSVQQVENKEEKLLEDQLVRVS